MRALSLFILTVGLGSTAWAAQPQGSFDAATPLAAGGWALAPEHLGGRVAAHVDIDDPLHADGLTAHSPWTLHVYCAPSCAGRECGDDGCGGLCGACIEGQRCEASACVEEQRCEADTCATSPVERDAALPVEVDGSAEPDSAPVEVDGAAEPDSAPVEVDVETPAEADTEIFTPSDSSDSGCSTARGAPAPFIWMIVLSVLGLLSQRQG